MPYDQWKLVTSNDTKPNSGSCPLKTCAIPGRGVRDGGASMSRLKTLLRMLLALLAAMQLSACSKTVQWEEEVPLNTGEVIWVKRFVTYKYQGAGGNPLDMAYRPDWTEEIAFEWKDKKYRYVGDARLMLLAISPNTQRPVLVARANNRQWHWSHNYRCTTPFYVQFVPSADGRDWPWPPSIEPWLYNLSHNLMAKRDDPEKMKSRYTASDRAAMDQTMAIQDPSSARIDPTFKSDTCFK